MATSATGALPPEYPRLAELTKEQLQRLYVKNKFELTKHVSTALGAHPQYFGGDSWYIQWYNAPQGSEAHNGLEHQDVPDEHIPAALDIVMHSLQNRSFSWVTGPGDQKRLEYFLQRKDFVVDEEAPTMAVDLSQLFARTGVHLPNGLTISDVDVSGVKAWTRTWTRQATQVDVAPWIRIYGSMLNSLHRNQFSMFIASMDGDQVGTGYIHCFAGVASIHAINVRPEARRRGIGRALTEYAMCKAASLGYNVATLTAVNSSSGLFNSLGFQEFGHVKLNVLRPLADPSREQRERDKIAEAEEEGWCVV
ncbi:hypothetical protein SCUP515_00305 [Seiridium cupressi]